MTQQVVSSQEVYTNYTTQRYTAVIGITASNITMDTCTFTDNKQVYLIESEAAIWNALNCDFTGNDSFAFLGNCANGWSSTFTNCRFSYKEPMLNLDSTFCFNIKHTDLTFIDCDFGEATFNDRSCAAFVDSNMNQVGSVLGEGSPAMVVSLLALMVSVASISISISLYKKKLSLPL